MTLSEAQTELSTILIAIGEYVQGKRRKRFISMLAGNRNEMEFDSPQQLFDYLVKRRKELEEFIDSLTPATSTLTPTSFTGGKTVPMIFKRNS
jgi:hypothetical protein